MQVCHYTITNPATEEDFRQAVAAYITSGGTLLITTTPSDNSSDHPNEAREFTLRLLVVHFDPLSIWGQDTTSNHWLGVTVDGESIVAQEVS